MAPFAADRAASPARRWEAGSLLGGGLLAFLLACYALLVYLLTISAWTLWAGGGAAAFGTPWPLGAASLAVLAATIRPVARWLREGVDDVIHGQPDDPYVLMARLDALLQGMGGPEASLPAVARAIASDLHLTYVAVEVEGLADASGGPAVFDGGAPAPPAAATVHRVPIAYLGVPLGALRVGPRSGGRPLSRRDAALLGDVARQLGSALYAVRLTRDVQASRERAVAAREEERRRIRHDLHDGLAPTLSALQLQAGGIARLMRSQPDVAEGQMEGLRANLRGATAEIRRLVDGLRPPMLDELGLVGAVQHQFGADSPLVLDVAAPEPLPRLRAAVEVAAYRIASEAVHNAVRHSGAARCTVRFASSDGLLRIEVLDDGAGLPAEPRAGVGMASMRERAAELGGTLVIEAGAPRGTRVVAALPLAGAPNGGGASSSP